ncbi:hypothetical protein [Agromyces aureus]|uniref:Uncharacterized protein n=1 Tax=Agromyces aureus TaxID=453304 RepID=A0A191WEE5_9MICO|nr:hypothetical protein [Agromyces aureus]ANJ26650.1 hypothetical protein ATC03_07930 [Agromyces aureus]
MSYRSFAPTIRKYLTTADQYAVELPDVLAADITKKLALIEAANNLDLTGPSVAEATYDAISNGKNPLDDKEVLRATVRSALLPIVSQSGIANVGIDRLSETVRDNIDELVAAYQPAYDSTGERFTEAHAILTAHGITGLDDPRVSSMGLDIARANLDAREAHKILHDLHEAIGTLLYLVGRAEGTAVGALLQNVDAGDATATEILDAFRGSKRADHWDIATAGYRISLATPTEVEARREQAYSAQSASHREAQRDHVQEARAAEYVRMNAR